MARVLFHIDLNAFFVNAEILRNSSYEDVPLVVGSLSRRGVVSTASYSARSLGIHSAMPMSQALQICPQLVVVPVDFEWYEKLSKQFFDYVRSYTPYVEPVSIDECFVDVTDIIKKYPRPLDLAWQIQKGLKENTGLSCSIGVAPNRFLAKMASDMRKPMGITVLRKQEIAKKLWPLPIEEMWGIGKKTAPILRKNKIETIGDLADPKNETLVLRILGKSGFQRIENARGNDSNRLSFTTSMQSLSQSTTLSKDVEDYDEIKNTFKKLAYDLSKRLKEERVIGKNISITIRYADFSTIVRSLTLEKATNEMDILLEYALYLFDKNNLYEQPIRHLGISLGSLIDRNNTLQQISFFEPQVMTNNDILDELNKNFDKPVFKYASDLVKK
ncbi:MAG: DNA polymerase IV [Traorella sp.]